MGGRAYVLLHSYFFSPFAHTQTVSFFSWWWCLFVYRYLRSVAHSEDFCLDFHGRWQLQGCSQCVHLCGNIPQPGTLRRRHEELCLLHVFFPFFWWRVCNSCDDVCCLVLFSWSDAPPPLDRLGRFRLGTQSAEPLRSAACSGIITFAIS
jgi:hypothetical protein